ncbi:PepSY domain-containing protein [Alteromonas stellipolaris]|uniref:PepSY domain-containing protein n=1 Tax=Alteromonas stellipolaris TaxID=233316 RepID=UPI001E1474B0|nr:PepSY domain-containing protein [Alteromonas stellipolaris]MBZ2162977.1 PepSY domain-containing protein [Alteromonas stellipolaris]
MVNTLRAVALVLTLFICSGGNAIAQQEKSGELSKSQAVERARQAEAGRVLRVSQTNQKYRVKVLKESGRVVSVDVDKRSGKVKTSKNNSKD